MQFNINQSDINWIEEENGRKKIFKWRHFNICHTGANLKNVEKWIGERLNKKEIPFVLGSRMHMWTKMLARRGDRVLLFIDFKMAKKGDFSIDTRKASIDGKLCVDRSCTNVRQLKSRSCHEAFLSLFGRLIVALMLNTFPVGNDDGFRFLSLCCRATHPSLPPPLGLLFIINEPLPESIIHRSSI